MAKPSASDRKITPAGPEKRVVPPPGGKPGVMDQGTGSAAPSATGTPGSDRVLVQCPACSARYLAPVAQLKAAGGEVKCTKCDHRWRHQLTVGASETDANAEAGSDFEALLMASQAGPAASLAGTEIADEHFGAFPPGLKGQKPEKAPLPENEPTLARWRKPVQLGLACLLIGGLFSALTAAVALRADVVRAWPPSAGLYQSIGLGVQVQPFALEEVAQDRLNEGGHSFMVVSGAVRNTWEEPLRAPSLEVTVADAEGRELDRFPIVLEAEYISGAGALDFAVQRMFPQGADQIRVRILEAP